MNHTLAFLALVLTCGAPGPAAAHGPQHHEKIEWTWADRPERIVPGLPNVLLVGDSITRNYYPFAAKALEGRANTFLFSTSASVGDGRLAGQIADYGRMIGTRFAVVHFNNGMHGWAYSEQDYGSGLPKFVASLRRAAPGTRLVWATTTPVRADAMNGATNARIDARNAIALRLMASAAILIDDQHDLMAGRASLYSDDVHFGPEGAAIQGAAVAASVAALLRPWRPAKDLGAETAQEVRQVLKQVGPQAFGMSVERRLDPDWSSRRRVEEPFLQYALPIRRGARTIRAWDQPSRTVASSVRTAARGPVDVSQRDDLAAGPHNAGSLQP